MIILGNEKLSGTRQYLKTILENLKVRSRRKGNSRNKEQRVQGHGGKKAPILVAVEGGGETDRGRTMCQVKGCDLFSSTQWGAMEGYVCVCVCVCELPWCFLMITLEVWEQEEIMKTA